MKVVSVPHGLSFALRLKILKEELEGNYCQRSTVASTARVASTRRDVTDVFIRRFVVSSYRKFKRLDPKLKALKIIAVEAK